MILAGLILKLATYGYLRVLIPMLPEASAYFGPLVQTVALVTLVYSSLTTLRQTDFKVLVAYSSIAHMSVVVIGLFSDTLTGIEGGILLSIAHGIVSPALFFCVGGVLYDKYHTRVIRYYRGLTQFMPVFSALFFLIILGNMGTPLTVN
jgi:NADH-ubiquinone oxidoreductase chain 4